MGTGSERVREGYGAGFEMSSTKTHLGSGSGHVRGGMILSAAVILSKLLGLLYIVPLYHVVGTEGIFITMVGYIPYTVILTLTTMGIPLAFSKYVAKYNALGDFRRGKRLLRSSFYLMLVLGCGAFILSYLSAPLIVNWLQAPEALWTIRSVCSALMIVPAMALLRGYFQGWNSMGPTAVSQVIEQFIRVLFFLLTAWMMLHLGYSMEAAIAVASLGTLVGAASGLTVLLFYWYKRREGIHRQVLASPQTELDSKLKLYRELLRYTLPISFVTLAIPLFMFIDMLLYKPLLSFFGYSMEQAKTAFSILSGTAHKVMMIPVSIATAFSLAVLPELTGAYERGERAAIQTAIQQRVSFLLYLMLPSSVGLFVLAEPINIALFGDTSGVRMLQWYAGATVWIALFTVTSSMLQGLGAIRSSVWSLLLALVVKALGIPLALFTIGENGAVLATICGFFVGSLANTIHLYRKVSWEGHRMLKELIQTLFWSGLMGGVVFVFSYFWTTFLSLTRMNAIFQLTLGCIGGALLYILMTKNLPGAGRILRLINGGKRES